MNLFDLLEISECDARAVFTGLQYPWQILPRLASFLSEYAKTLPADFEQAAESVWVGSGTVIAKTACIQGPAIIGRNCEIRHGAYLRENVILGDGVVVGNSSEVKNSLLFNGVQLPHFNYVGDSVLGFKAHLGAGVKISNVKSDFSPVTVKLDGVLLETGLVKFGALLGARAEIGCNAVLNPGTVIGKNSTVYPLVSARGFIPPDSIVKAAGVITKKR